MSKFTTVYICQQCGYRSSQYIGKCPECDSWNSMVEEVEESHQSSVVSRQTKQKAEIIELSKINQVNYKRLSTKIEEFDRVLGSGIVPGSIVLLSGDPGIGKSTLLTQLALNINSGVIARRETTKQSSQEIATLPLVARNDKCRVLYIAGEESAQQIKIRVDRINPKSNLSVLNEVDIDIITEAIKQTNPSLVIVDSIQTMETADLHSIAGSVGQVRECALRIARVAKQLHIPIFLVGHVNKDGNLAGPKTLEHMVDVVLSLEGEQSSQFRILRANKNRFGATDEVGIFEMDESGMKEVNNPSKIFLDEKVEAPGSAVVATLTGLRPILVEIQALVSKSNLPSPRRVGSGIDNNRLILLIAVLQKRLGLALYEWDVFVNVTGGLKIFEPAADLGICMAIISSFKNKVIKEKTIFIGEVGLLGEIRKVNAIDKRINEAKKLGYKNIISPVETKDISPLANQVLL